MRDVSDIVKAYDIRGVVPDQLDAELARAFGAAFAELVRTPSRTERRDSIVIGYDMRPSSPELAAAFADGVTAQGLDAVLIGLASTDMLYFASGHLGLPGAMFTASHNPAQYNGIKLCLSGASPVGQDTGLAQLRDRVNAGQPSPQPGAPRGTISERDLLTAYADFLHGLVDIRGSRQLTVVVDAGNGMGGYTVPAVLSGLPLRVVPLYFELDGTFPNHEANPIEAANMVDLQKAVLAEGADLGLAFDGDADRCFVVDERGEIVSPSTITALVAERELAREPGGTVIHNLICSRTVAEVVRESGGTPVRTRVGHSFIKEVMASTGAIFGGEHSGHFYFRDFWRADSGMLAALHVLAALGRQDGTLSALLAPYDRYVASGEINTTVADAAARMAAVEAAYTGRDGIEIDHLDGLTVSAADWWLNLRPSNTEPLLRLNAEAVDVATMERVRDEVLLVVRG
ncbi:MAG TPA: phosphomannomutase/phosphoglucomutase [Mycobacteriales bacterium]|nr:phosphomannomutase/phosphoglucomutase [Mycobacteriales bacterium]